MTSYELLENEACGDVIEIIDYNFKCENIKCLYCDGSIAISTGIESSAERVAILAEELGHYYTTVGDILDQTDSLIRNRNVGPGSGLTQADRTRWSHQWI